MLTDFVQYSLQPKQSWYLSPVRKKLVFARKVKAMFGNGLSPAVAEEWPSLQGGDALQEKGFQLANFIISDRRIALEILANALSKLQKQRSREAKRDYWRKRFLKQKITRMVRSEGDALQWLIYFESERYEKQQEQKGRPAEHEMVIRYIKHLAQMTTAMSSFYVNVGINRLLRNYSTPEVREVYESVTQHFPDDQEYRRVKLALMRKLKLRFGDSLRTCTAQYGELRFETLGDQAYWVEVVPKCLEAFTPWSTHKACTALFTSGYLGSLPMGLDGKALRSLGQDLIEVNRCHVFLHPACHSRVTEALGLDSAQCRLAVPRFFMNAGNTNAPGSGTPAPAGLTEQERREIGERLSVESERCRRAKPKSLTVRVDGAECAWLVNSQGSRTQCRIDEGANLIEILTDFEGKDLLLATHWIEYTEFQGIAPAAATVSLGNGRELLLEITPQAVRDDACYAVLSFQCRPASTFERIRESLTSRSLWLYEFPKYALLSSLLLGIGWSIASLRANQELSSQRRAMDRLDKELSLEKAARVSTEKKLGSEQQAVEAFLLAPDESLEGHARGGDETREPVIASSAHAAQVILQLPTPRGLQTSYKAVLRPFLASREILAETFPKPANSLQPARLEFVLPMSFVKAGKHYMVELDSLTSAGRAERVYTFTFYVNQE